MFNIFRKNDEYKNKLIKQCPSCHGFIQGKETKCRHCGSSTQLKQNQPANHKDKEPEKQPNDQSDLESEKFSI
jgi:hypothetical protein